jgi:3' exoribonuclease, RNase T-like
MAENNIMLDLETLATGIDATILTIGAVKFDPFVNYHAGNIALTDLDTYYARIDLDTQVDRVVDDGTVEWWSKQNKVAQDEAFNPEGRIHLDQALADLHKFIWGSKLTWCQGLTFDIPILEHAYRQHKRDTPWRFWETRCSRSLCDLVQVQMPEGLAVATHDAREDCFKQIINTQLVLEKLGITKFVR